MVDSGVAPFELLIFAVSVPRERNRDLYHGVLRSTTLSPTTMPIIAPSYGLPPPTLSSLKFNDSVNLLMGHHTRPRDGNARAKTSRLGGNGGTRRRRRLNAKYSKGANAEDANSIAFRVPQGSRSSKSRELFSAFPSLSAGIRGPRRIIEHIDEPILDRGGLQASGAGVQPV